VPLYTLKYSFQASPMTVLEVTFAEEHIRMAAIFNLEPLTGRHYWVPVKLAPKKIFVPMMLRREGYVGLCRNHEA
jgi:hypothetical protein